MALIFGNNIAGASKGAFAVLSVEDTLGTAPFSVLDADVVTGSVTAVAGAVPLTGIQTTALSSIFRGLITIGTVAGNELEYLRKLVGVLPLETGDSVALSAANVGGNVWRLSAALSGAGTAFVYVPNTAAAGPFTGDGSNSTSGSGGPPTGPAGGVLGYPGSTYPDPNGLAPGDGAWAALDVLPIKAGTAAVNVTVDPTAAANTAGSALGVFAGDGGNSDDSSVGGAGGDVTLRGGEGGDGAATKAPGLGGKVTVQGGTSGAYGGTANTSSTGSVVIAGGLSASGGKSGQVKILDVPEASYPVGAPLGMDGGGILIATVNAGVGIAAGPLAFAAGDAGDITIQTGAGGFSGGNTSGTAGSISIVSGKGGSAFAANTAKVGGPVTIACGEGGDGDGATAAAAGGTLTLTGGAGGTPGTGNGAVGGLIILTGGAGTKAANGGGVLIGGGVGGTTSGNGGAVFLAGGTIPNDGGSGDGGDITIFAGLTGNGGGDGGDVAIEAGLATTGTSGEINIGTQTSGALDVTSKVTVGHTNIDSVVGGRHVEAVDTYVPVAATTIPVTRSVILLQPAGVVLMTATPTLQTAGITAGTRVSLVGNNGNSTEFQRESDLAGSALRLTNPSRTVGQYDVLELVFDGLQWCQTSFSDNT